MSRAPRQIDRWAQPRPRWNIEDVLARTDLAAVLDDIAQPSNDSLRGRRWHCPIRDHDDRHASVTTHTDHHGHERWRCWSGDDTHRGDALDLVMATQHLDKIDAIDWLARRAGMTPDQPLPALAARKPTPAPVAALDPCVERYAQACEVILTTRTGAPVREWFAERGLGMDVLRANHVGADPGRHRLPRQRGLPYGAAVGAVLPAYDPDGRFRYLQTRYLNPGDGPRYDNPAASLGANPRLAWTAPVGNARPGVLIVCEGIPDALTAAQAGISSVAILGAQAADQGVATRLANRAERLDVQLVAIPDNDSAGHTWADRLGALLTELGNSLTVISPSGDGLDLNDWALHDPRWTDALPTLVEARGIDEPPAREAAGRELG
jgi:hypothetical protein